MCAVCDEFGNLGCPACQKEPEIITCPVCDGTGRQYFDDEWEGVPKEIYDLLPAYERNIDRCERCGGLGEIEDN